MKRSKELENILDICLERVFAGETVEDCLRDYPQHAGELRELLETVTGVREAVDITPRAEFRQQAYREFQTAIRDMRPVKSSGFSGFFSVHRWVTTAVAAIAVIVLAGGGTVYAASGSLPDSPLYNVKLATESVRIAFAFSDESKTELYAAFSNRRVNEIVAMAEQGEVDGVNRAADKLDEQLIAMAKVNNSDVMYQTLSTSPFGGAVPEEDMLTASSQEAADAPPPSSVDGPVVKTEPTVPREALIGEPVPGEENAMFGPTADGNDMLSADNEEHALTDDRIPLEEDDLKGSVMDDALSNTVKLEEAVKNSSEALREALERAIEIALRGYGIAISNIR